MADVKRTDEIQGEILHVYDGIEEADNKLPNWWLLTFYGAILFGIGYWFYYHEYQMGPTPTDAFAADMASRAVEGGEASAEALMALAQDPSTVNEGREAFAATCVACHGAGAEGQIGPNLTDDHWLHGGGPTDIYTSVRAGITAAQARMPGSAGMPAWGPQLGESQTRAVVAYILSIRDTNVEGREPEGDVWDPNAPTGAEGEAPEGGAPETGAETTNDTADTADDTAIGGDSTADDSGDGEPTEAGHTDDPPGDGDHGG